MRLSLLYLELSLKLSWRDHSRAAVCAPGAFVEHWIAGYKPTTDFL